MICEIVVVECVLMFVSYVDREWSWAVPGRVVADVAGLAGAVLAVVIYEHVAHGSILATMQAQDAVGFPI